MSHLTIGKVLKLHSEKVGLLLYCLFGKYYTNDGKELIIELIKLHIFQKYEKLFGFITKVDVDINITSENVACIKCYLKGHDGYPGAAFHKDLGDFEFYVEVDAIIALLTIYNVEIEEAFKEICKANDYNE